MSKDYFWIIYAIENLAVNKDGDVESLWLISVNLFTNIIIIVSLDLFVYTRYHTWINIVIMLFFTFCLYIAFLFMVHHVKIFKSVASMNVSFRSGIVWVDIIFICGACYLIDMGIKTFNFTFIPTIAGTLQRIVCERGSCDNETDLPKSIIDKLKIYDNNENDEENENEDENNENKLTKNMNDNEDKFNKITEQNNDDEKHEIIEEDYNGNENYDSEVTERQENDLKLNPKGERLFDNTFGKSKSKLIK
jgi:hypothetical protein